MAEAADQGIRKLLYHCQTPRAIPMLVHTLKTDKNARIRSSCASYLAQGALTVGVHVRSKVNSTPGNACTAVCIRFNARNLDAYAAQKQVVSVLMFGVGSLSEHYDEAMETWDVGALGVRADDLESGMKTAAQDASAEARQAARALTNQSINVAPGVHAFVSAHAQRMHMDVVAFEVGARN
eukprot:655531-Pelagomonas_calceolata.AAC.14